MTIPEAAEALGVSERTVWRYLSSGRLSGETIGPVGQQRTLIDPGAVEVLRSGRGGNEARELRTRVEELSDQIAALRAESEQLRSLPPAGRSAAFRSLCHGAQATWCWPVSRRWPRVAPTADRGRRNRPPLTRADPLG
jgi:excisionase family DNA binding protein